MKYIENQIVGELSIESLQGRQSVRATFRLPPEAIQLLSLMANQLGLKQKSLFDQLVEDRQTLEQVADQMQGPPQLSDSRQQKTYVLSKSSLAALDAVAKKTGVPRDILVELSINRLLAVAAHEQEKQKKRRAALAELVRYQQQGEELLHKLEDFLGSNDPAYAHMLEMLAFGRRQIAALRAQVDKGSELEAYL